MSGYHCEYCGKLNMLETRCDCETSKAMDAKFLMSIMTPESALQKVTKELESYREINSALTNSNQKLNCELNRYRDVLRQFYDAFNEYHQLGRLELLGEAMNGQRGFVNAVVAPLFDAKEVEE